MPINNDKEEESWKEKFAEFSICKPWELEDENFFLDVSPEQIYSLLLEAEARGRTEAVEDHITELKQCPQCFTMKSFSTAVCFRCLDRKEAMREAKAELRKKIEGKTRFISTRYEEIDPLYEKRSIFIEGYNTALSDIITLLEEEK